LWAREKKTRGGSPAGGMGVYVSVSTGDRTGLPSGSARKKKQNKKPYNRRSFPRLFGGRGDKTGVEPANPRRKKSGLGGRGQGGDFIGTPGKPNGGGDSRVGTCPWKGGGRGMALFGRRWGEGRGPGQGPKGEGGGGGKKRGRIGKTTAQNHRKKAVLIGGGGGGAAPLGGQGEQKKKSVSRSGGGGGVARPSGSPKAQLSGKKNICIWGESRS